MAERKRLAELTIKNNFMFGAVMCDEDNCKGLLERRSIVIHLKILVWKIMN